MKGQARVAALLAALASITLSAGQNPAPAPQTPTFKVQVDYVEVDALVTDERGNFVRDLKKEDFQVFEDGKAQTITTFSIVDIPIERADRPLFASAPIEPDVRTNERPFDGRVYVMVIDDMHTNFGRSNRVKVAARQFIQRYFSANDLMAVVHTAGPTDASQEFTNNKRLLIAAVEKVQGRKLQSATAGRTAEYYRQRQLQDPDASSGRRDRINDPDDMERGYNARVALSTLKNIADWFGSVRGRRKAILFVSEGIDYDINDVFNNREASTIIDETRETIAAATRSNVAIYGIDPRGLTDLGDETIEIQSFPDDTSLGIGIPSLVNEVRLSQDSLRVLSNETGGFAVVNANDYRTAYERLVRDNSSYYVLAYYPPNPKRDGRFHKIEVRVTRPGLTVRARRGYANPRGKPPDPLPVTNASLEVRDALNSPLPVSGLTLNVFAAPFKGTAPNASVVLGVEMRGRDLKLDGNNRVELSYRAVDAEGKIRGGSTDSLSLSLKPETKARIQQTGLRMLNRLEIPPGRYQLRIAAHDTSGGAVGSVLYDLEVPDFTKAPLTVSGIVLTSATAAAQPTARPDDQLRQVLPAPPVALRTFPQNDEVILFAEVYDNETAPHKVDVTATVTADEGRVVFKNEEERSSADLGGRRGGYGYTTRIPMKDLAPGTYVLKVEGRSRLGQGATASRELQFTVRPAQTAQ